MHELPPPIHRTRDRMIDVHHTILPLTARPKPDAAAMIAEAVPLGNGLSVLSPEGMVVHAAAHPLARDGWGRPTRPMTRLAFYARSHWLRMPPAMLARHLWVKWRRGAAG